jgi:hypothetical protein
VHLLSHIDQDVKPNEQGKEPYTSYLASLRKLRVMAQDNYHCSITEIEDQIRIVEDLWDEIQILRKERLGQLMVEIWLKQSPVMDEVESHLQTLEFMGIPKKVVDQEFVKIYQDTIKSLGE